MAVAPLELRMTLHFTPVDSDLEAENPDVRALQPAAIGSGFYRRSAKRILDIFLTLLAAPIVAPFILVMAGLIALDGHSPFYSQLRVGRGGAIFRMWKLRTMVFNADALLEEHLRNDPVARREWESTQKLKNDPRVTLVGRVLRKSSLDELPQLLNVLLGSMSLVGPRPMMLCQRGSYFGKSYYNLQPGITGLWQVSDRNEGEFVGRVRYDDAYDRMVSFKLDTWIIFRTVAVVIRGTGY